MKNLVLFSGLLLLCTACETGTRYDTNTSTKKSVIVDEIETEELYDPTHSESYYIDQGEDDYAEEIALANSEVSDNISTDISEEEFIEASQEEVQVESQAQDFKGGTISDGLNIATVRKANHANYVRIVFDSDGSNKLGSYQIEHDPAKKLVVVTLDGYRTFSATFPAFENSSIVENMDFAKYLDDSGYKIHINLRDITKIKVLALESPARLVIDVQKP